MIPYQPLSVKYVGIAKELDISDLIKTEIKELKGIKIYHCKGDCC